MRKLQLNEPIENYKEFYGEIIYQMPKLIAEGRIPLSVYGLMEARLAASTGFNAVRSSWLDYSFETGDGIVYHPDGKVKLVHDASPLRELTSESKLSEGALILPEGIYEELEGQKLTKTQVKKNTENYLSKKRILNNPFWQFFAREDSDLLKEYAKLVSGYTKASENMAVFSRFSQDVPTMRFWSVQSLRSCRSFAIGNDLGRDSLCTYNDRLVGVRAE